MTQTVIRRWVQINKLLVASVRRQECEQANNLIINHHRGLFQRCSNLFHICAALVLELRAAAVS